MRDRRRTTRRVWFHTYFRLGTRFQGVDGRFAIFSAPLGQNFGRTPPLVAQNCPPGAEVTPGRGRSLLLDLSLAQYGGTHDQKAQTPGATTPLLPEALPAPSKIVVTQKRSHNAPFPIKECHCPPELGFVTGFTLRSPVCTETDAPAAPTRRSAGPQWGLPHLKKKCAIPSQGRWKK